MADDEKAWATIVHDLAKRPVSDKESSYKEIPHDEIRSDLALDADSDSHKGRFNRLLVEAVKRPKSSG